MKKISVFIFFLMVSINLSWGQRPVYDEAKHYQWRAMENGPWVFKPKAYYYAWNLFTNPLGIGAHKNYIKKHSPNIGLRTATTPSALVLDEYYRKELKFLKSLHEKEMILQVDRTINLVDPVMGEKISNSQKRFLSNLSEYVSMLDEIDLDRETYFTLEYLRIIENLSTIKNAYIENAKRQEIYVQVASDLDKLNESLMILVRFAYNKKINKEFFNQ